VSNRILVVSFYYAPDLSAGSFRTTALVAALLEQDPTVFVDVLTTQPNRYGTFASAAPAEEVHERVRIRRIPLPTHKSGMRDQSAAFMHFFRAAHGMVGRERYSVVYATSSRLMTAVLGARLARKVRAPLYLDIRDIFVETMADVLPRKVAPFITPVLSVLERPTINAASHVNLVSPGFAGYFERRYPRQAFSYFTNGIDEEFLATAPSVARHASGAGVKILYAGNIGESQGLHAVLPGLAKRLAERADFIVVGDGGRRQQLVQALAEARVTNVTLKPPMSRSALIEEYRAADVLFLHLNDYAAFRRVLPSKVFEYAALGKPVWAGVAGYSAEFLTTEVRNAGIFAPCDVEGGIAAFDGMEIRDTPRPEFIEKFRRVNIMRRLAADVMRVARGVSAASPSTGT
jgi:glycosyltransferase involved in cell wall biosynthesis